MKSTSEYLVSQHHIDDLNSAISSKYFFIKQRIIYDNYSHQIPSGWKEFFFEKFSFGEVNGMERNEDLYKWMQGGELVTILIPNRGVKAKVCDFLINKDDIHSNIISGSWPSNISECYIDIGDEVEISFVVDKKWPVLISGGKTDPQSSYNLALFSSHYKNSEFFEFWCMQSALNGFFEAERSFAKYFFEMGNEKEAYYWLARCIVDHGDLYSMLKLAEFLIYCKNNDYDPWLAEFMLVNIAKKGMVKAYFVLGKMHISELNGFNGSKNLGFSYLIEVFKYCNDDEILQSLGDCYIYGIGCEKNITMGKKILSMIKSNKIDIHELDKIYDKNSLVKPKYDTEEVENDHLDYLNIDDNVLLMEEETSLSGTELDEVAYQDTEDISHNFLCDQEENCNNNVIIEGGIEELSHSLEENTNQVQSNIEKSDMADEKMEESFGGICEEEKIDIINSEENKYQINSDSIRYESINTNNENIHMITEEEQVIQDFIVKDFGNDEYREGNQAFEIISDPSKQISNESKVSANAAKKEIPLEIVVRGELEIAEELLEIEQARHKQILQHLSRSFSPQHGIPTPKETISQSEVTHSQIHEMYIFPNSLKSKSNSPKTNQKLFERTSRILNEAKNIRKRLNDDSFTSETNNISLEKEQPNETNCSISLVESPRNFNNFSQSKNPLCFSYLAESIKKETYNQVTPSKKLSPASKSSMRNSSPKKESTTKIKERGLVNITSKHVKSTSQSQKIKSKISVSKPKKKYVFI